jgi:DNA-binding transcriptional regulator YiaG
MQTFHTSFISDETVAERKATAQRRHDEYEAERQKQLAAQASPFNTPEERIRIWEQLHGLKLPLQPEHRLMRVIATQTDLTLTDVLAEQQRRASGTKAPEPAL